MVESIAALRVAAALACDAAASASACCAAARALSALVFLSLEALYVPSAARKASRA